ncbi:mitochondrial substrate carrier family B-like isoform X3 [Olea europaea subsp. europaea]|uniref:Mitochondrial substrate carrier family B-like isoform X3 n=1 Tax=Olea europaea subsp. europaea TaxID=158383 RepID=A0A8S0PCY2_OLEEU|nr:mitochondrial substrate carrier family B-like isoform X3 [Olea europaea subsp. europaea]
MQTEARVGVVVKGGGLNTGLLVGGVAGAVSKTCTTPLAHRTILFQVRGMHSDAASLRKANIWHEASRILREEGFRAFWKGNLITIVRRLPYSSFSFYAFERYKNVGGGLAGITAASVMYPLDLVRTRLVAQVCHLVCVITATGTCILDILTFSLTREPMETKILCSVLT